MLKLMNLSTHEADLVRFQAPAKSLELFLEQHQLDGVEVIMQGDWNPETLPKKLAVGMHMCFWPIWLDFWKGNQTVLLEQFGDLESIEGYYGGSTRDVMVDYYRRDLQAAVEMGVQYVVFHVSHVALDHCYTYAFDYTDEEIADAFIELVNEVFEGFEGKLDLLLENQWWPGLTLLNKAAAVKLMEGIHYPHKGFMLDVGHMMNTNLELKTEHEAIDYVLTNISNLGDQSSYIKGIHLNSSLSGEYVKEAIASGGGYKAKDSFFDRYISAFGHIGQIDRHQPFENPEIQAVISAVNPKYLVYEFATGTLDVLEDQLRRQNKALL